MDKTSPQPQLEDIRSAMENVSLPTKMHSEESANGIIATYITERVKEFCELNQLRKEVSTSKCSKDICDSRLRQASGVEKSGR